MIYERCHLIHVHTFAHDTNIPQPIKYSFEAGRILYNKISQKLSERLKIDLCLIKKKKKRIT